MKIILASKSPRRKLLLEQIGLNFEVMVSDINEGEVEGNDLIERVNKLARIKAQNIAKKVKDAVVIGADTLVVMDNKVVGKPRTEEEARNMLKWLSGKTHGVYTGVCVINTINGNVMSDYSTSEVMFRNLSDKEIEDYIKTGEAFDKAGGYDIVGTHSIKFVESINGSHTNVIGLPLEKLIPMLRENGINI